MNARGFFRHLILLFCAALLASCAGGAALRFEKLAGSTAKEEYLPTIARIQHDAGKLYGKTNQLLYYMDIGLLFHYAGLYDSSNAYLLNAVRVFDDLFARSITNEAVSFLINDNVRPYRGKPYELVLLHQIIALNYLAQGNTEDALVESRQTQLLMNELERKDKNGAKYSTDGMFHYISSIAYDGAGRSDDAMISLFLSVQAFNKGPVTLPVPVKKYAACMFKMNNRDNDIGQLNLAADTAGGVCTGYANGQTEVVFVGYAGRGPALAEEKWQGTYIRGSTLIMNHISPDGRLETMQMLAPPLPEKEYEQAAKGKKNKIGTTFHISVSLPAEKRLRSQTDGFSISAAGSGSSAAVRAMAINDFDLQLAKNLEDTRGATLGRTAVRVVLRTIAAQKAKNEMGTANPLANLLIGLGTDLLADQLERADTRSCFLIPRTIQIARIPVKPGTYSFDVSALNIAGAPIGHKLFENVTVKQGEKKFLFYCSFK